MSSPHQRRNTFSRRGWIALLGAGVTASLASSFRAEPSTGEAILRDARDRFPPPDPPRVPGENGTYPPADARNIVDFGAVENSADDDETVARENRRAILRAAMAAGSGGSIYIPPGSFYFSGEETPLLSFGKQTPPGISVYGAGSNHSVLGLSQMTSEIGESSPDLTGIYVDPKDEHENVIDHGTVEFAHFRFDGNFENLPNLSEMGAGSRGMRIENVNLSLYDLHFRGWYQTGLMGGNYVDTIAYCTFEDNGIGRHNDTAGESIGHHIELHTGRGETTLIQQCVFSDTAGSAINWRYGDGIVRVINCSAKGTGANFIKLSAGGVLQLLDVLHEANTDSIEAKVDERPGGNNFWGRNFIQSLEERGEQDVLVHTENVVATNIREYAFQSRNTSNIYWVGDQIAITNTNFAYDDDAIRTRSGGSFPAISIERLSVHNTGGQIFSLEFANGRIGTLYRGTDDAIGTTDQVAIGDDRPGSQLEVQVSFDAKAIGISAFSD